MRLPYLPFLVSSLFVLAASSLVSAEPLEQTVQKIETFIQQKFPGSIARGIATSKVKKILGDDNLTAPQKQQQLDQLYASWNTDGEANIDTDFDDIPDSVDPFPLIASYSQLSWSMNSLQLGWKFEQEVTAIEVDSFTSSLENSKLTDKGYGGSIDLGTKVSTSAQGKINANPLKFFGLSDSELGINSEANFSAQGHGHYSKKYQEKLRNLRQALGKVEKNTKLSNFHLEFTFTFYNHSNEDIIIRTSKLPIRSAGNVIGYASYKGSEEILIPANRHGGVDCPFEMKLDTTTALNAVSALENGTLNIDVLRSQMDAYTRSGKAGLLSRVGLIEKNTFELNFFYDDLPLRTWRIAKRNTNGDIISIEDAMVEINRQIGSPFFQIEEHKLVAVGTRKLDYTRGICLISWREDSKNSNLSQPLTQNINIAFCSPEYLTADFPGEIDKTLVHAWIESMAKAGNTHALKVFFREAAASKDESNLAKALFYLNKSATQGDSVAQTLLGGCYLNGTGTEQAPKQAVAWFRKAAEQNNADAQSLLSACYFDGTGVEQNYRQSVAWLRKAAEQNHADAQWILGACYIDGTGVEQNDKQAVTWFLKSAQQNNAEAQWRLGSCYIEGVGVEVDYKQAVDWCRKAVEQNNASAQWLLGTCYMNGTGVEQDSKQALELFHKSAQQNNAEAQLELGKCYLNGLGDDQDAEIAVSWFSKASQQNNADALCLLGLCLSEGIGIDPDPKLAITYLRKSAEQNNANAQWSLGECYMNGKGVESDPKQAVAWYHKAAEQRHDDAQATLGKCYLDGLGVNKDEKLALSWIREAAQQNNIDALSLLGACLLEGIGTDSDPSQAVSCFRKAAEQGNSGAQWALGECYFTGIGVEKDTKQAVVWYRKAAEQGHSVAQWTIGACYIDGTGVKKDAKQAAIWFQKSAEQNNTDALWRLGACHIDGNGVEQDFEKAISCFRTAAALNHPEAQWRLGACYAEGIGVKKDLKKAKEWIKKAADQGNPEAAKLLLKL